MERLIDRQMANIEKAYESIPMGGKLEFSKSAIEGIYQVLKELREYKDLEDTGRLIKTNIKVGDYIYVYAEYFKDNAKMYHGETYLIPLELVIPLRVQSITVAANDIIFQTKYKHISSSLENKTFSFSREAADLKLNDMKENNKGEQ